MQLLSLFQDKERQYGLPEGYLHRTAQIESSMNPKAKNPNSSASGLFQFIRSTARDYNLTNPFDPIASTDAAARLARDNASFLRRRLGRDPTAGELYLAHQQGPGGAANLLANSSASASSVVGSAAAGLNAGGGKTAGQLASHWTSKFGDLGAASNAAPGSVRAAQEYEARPRSTFSSSNTYAYPGGGPMPMSYGSLGGLGGYTPPPPEPEPDTSFRGYLRSPEFGDSLQALGMSLLSSPGNAPLSGMPSALQSIRGGRERAAERAEDREWRRMNFELGRQDRMQDRQWQLEDLARQQEIAQGDRQNTLEDYRQKLEIDAEFAGPADAPSGYRWNGGNLEAIPGGPADPAFARGGDGFSLSAGQTRFDANGNVIAAIPGDSADSAAEQRIARLSKNLQATGDFPDPSMARNVAVGIVDGRLRADRHPLTGVAQVVDIATGRTVFNGAGPAQAPQSQAPASGQASQPVPITPIPREFGEQYPNAGESFGVGGAAMRAANTIGDTIGVGAPYPEVQQTQANFDVLRESLLNDIAGAYGRQPPSWLLQEIRQLTPQSGSLFEGAGGAQVKLNALGQHLESELRVAQQSLGRDLSPTNRQELESRITGLESGLGRVRGALQAFSPRDQESAPAEPSQAAPAIREGQTATNPSTGARIIYRNGQWEPAQ